MEQDDNLIVRLKFDELGVAQRILLENAGKAMDNAHPPFSNFYVGAAVETIDGKIITGCNVENPSYGLTMCAERVTIFKSVSEGMDYFKRIAIIAKGKNFNTQEITPPAAPVNK